MLRPRMRSTLLNPLGKAQEGPDALDKKIGDLQNQLGQPATADRLRAPTESESLVG